MRQRIFLYVFALPVMLYVALVATLFVEQRNFIYHPGSAVIDAASSGVPGVHTIELRTSDGLTLRSWYLPPPDPTAPVILFLHGNGGDIGTRQEHLAHFAAAGTGALFLEYRGYGRNSGEPTETGLFRDAAAARQFLLDQHVGPERTVLYGESLGTGIAIESAVRAPCAAVILEAPYSSITAVAAWRFPIVPVRWLLKDRFDSLSRIGRLHTPLMVLQGTLDRIVPPAEGLALYRAANPPKQFWVSSNAGHNDLLGHGSVEAAIAFLHLHVTGWKRMD